VAARTPLGPTGTILVSVPAVQTYSPAMLLTLVVHELAHKISIAGAYPTDHRALDIAGAAVATYAKQELGIAGFLDLSFSGTGFVLFPSTLGGHARAMALQSDGKLVVAGRLGGEYGLIRVTPEGTLDTGFGANGSVVTNLPASGLSIHRLALLEDGRILAAGTGHNGQTYAMTAVRYLPDGSVDQSCGGSCISTYSYVNKGASAHGIAPQSDGKFLVAGYGYGPNGTSYGLLTRYLANGSLDTSFTQDGVINQNFDGYPTGFQSIRVQPDGKILVNGWVQPPSGDSQLLVVRFLPSGERDTTWNGTGYRVIPEASGVYAGSLLLEADGKLVSTLSPRRQGRTVLGLARLNGDGTFDTSFGQGGVAVVSSIDGNSTTSDVVREPSGKYLLVGSTANGAGAFTLGIARLGADGTPDTQFNEGGALGTGTALDAYPLLDNSTARALLLPEGKLAISATVRNGSETRFALFRFWL